MQPFDELPAPDQPSAKRSQLLTEILRQKIHEHGGWIPFSTFMAEALYHPDLGYYNSNTMDFGKAGDFTTAPEISPLFAHCFANACLHISEQLGSAAILEIGAGSGRF